MSASTALQVVQRYAAQVEEHCRNTEPTQRPLDPAAGFVAPVPAPPPKPEPAPQPEQRALSLPADSGYAAARDWAREKAAGMPSARRRVFIALCVLPSTRATGKAWASLPYLADMADCHLATLKRALTDLETAGLIVRERSSGGKGKTTTYRLTDFKQARDAPVTPSKPARGAPKQARDAPEVDLMDLKKASTGREEAQEANLAHYRRLIKLGHPDEAERFARSAGLAPNRPLEKPPCAPRTPP